MNAVFLSGFGQYHSFFHLNLFITKIKEKYKKIIVIAPKAAIGCFPDADEIVTLPDEYLSERGGNYPEVLEKLAGRNETDFDKITIKYLYDNGYTNENTEFYKYNDRAIIKIDSHKSNMLKISNVDIEYELAVQRGATHFDEIYSVYNYPATEAPEFVGIDFHPIGRGEYRDYIWLKEWLKTNSLQCSKNTYKKVQEKYGHLFNEKTFVFLSRNYKNKNVSANTTAMYPDCEEMLQFLTNNGIKIVNFGLPLTNFNISNENYVEISDKITNEEFVALVNLSNGLLMFLWAGAFVTCLSTNCDLFGLAKSYAEIIRGVDLLSGRAENKKIKTYKLYEEYKNKDWEKILQTLLNHKKSKLTFLKEDVKFTTIEDWKKYE